MSLLTVIVVVLGGAVGAVLRHLAGVLGRDGWPWGTLVVNVAGSAALGLLTGAAGALPRELAPLAVAGAGAGLCGTLTTWSAFAAEVVDLVREGRRRRAAAYLVVTTVGGIGAGGMGAAAAGWATAWAAGA